MKTRCEKLEMPENVPTRRGLFDEMKSSPPFSMITPSPYFVKSRPTNSAIAPATDAMGPTLARDEAWSIAEMIFGASSSWG